jgi:capsid protein
MVKYLNPGEEVDTFNPSRPNPAAADFTKQLIQWAANAVDMPYEVFANDWKDLNYSNARTVLLQAYLAFRVYQNHLVNHLCIPVWENFVSDCVAADIVKADGFGFRKDDYFKSAWITPGFPWVDPAKEAEAAVTDLDNLIETLADIHSSKGADWEEQLDQIAREKKKIKDLEKKYDIVLKAAPTTQPKEPKNENTDE